RWRSKMFEAHYSGRPRPAERPRARFNHNNRTYYLYTPPEYQKYKDGVRKFFNQYETDESLKELFDTNKIEYDLSVKLIFRLYNKGKKTFYGNRSDIYNLFISILDGLIERYVNLYITGKQ